MGMIVGSMIDKEEGMTENTLKRTPLYEIHLRSGAKMGPFGGWDMPIQYGTGVIAEHMAVRERCGIFDVSHMGEILCEGEKAEQGLNYLLTNDYSNMEVGQARYSLMCNEEGGVVDDLIVYKLADTKFMLVPNAANEEKDFAWIQRHNKYDITVRNVSSAYGQLALQGPLAEQILLRLLAPEDIPQKNYTFTADRMLAGVPCLLSRTGYTGEDGFEIYMPAESTVRIWEALMEAGRADGLVPCGLGARDTLRLEAGMPLYGHEIDDTILPTEAGLGIFVKKDKPEFIGKEALQASAPRRRKVGLILTGRGIARAGMDVYLEGERIGVTTSGTKTPYLNKALAVALVAADKREPGLPVQIDIRGRMVDAMMTTSPFYKRGKKS